MITNWPDVAALIVSGLIFSGSLGISAWLVVAGHPWFGLFAFIIVGTLKITTGGQP